MSLRRFSVPLLLLPPVALLDQVKVLARKEGRVPVVALAVKGRRGLTLVLDAEDLPAIAAEWARARERAAHDGQDPPTLALAGELDPDPPPSAA